MKPLATQSLVVVHLLFPPTYPWGKLTEEEEKIKKPEDIQELLEKYCKILSDDPIIVDEYCAVNCD